MKNSACLGVPRGRMPVSLFVGCLLMAATVHAQLYVHIKGARYAQHSSASPTLASSTDLPWSEMVGVFGYDESEFAAVTITPPGGLASSLEWLPDESMWGISDDLSFATKSELDAAVPNSASPYTYSFTPSGGGSAITSPLVMNGDTYPDPPHVSNFDEAQSIDRTQDFTLSWDAFDGGSAFDLILVFVRNQDTEVFATPLPGMPGALTGTATSTVIPANTLAPGVTYDCEILFFKTVDMRADDLSGAYGFSMYQSSTELTIQATTPPPPELYILGKSVDYSQTSTAAPSMDTEGAWSPIVAVFGFDDSDFGAIELQRPGLAPVALGWSSEENMWGLNVDNGYESQAALDADYPDSTSAYTMHFTSSDGGSSTDAPLVLNGASYPAAPHVTNFNATQAVDPEQAFALTWDSFSGGTTDDTILVFVYPGNGPAVFSSPFPGQAGALDGTATSIEIPAGTLSPGRNYELQLVFAKVVDQASGDVPGASGFAGYFAETEINLMTTGTAVGPVSTELLLQFGHDSGSIVGTEAQIDFPVTTNYQPLFVAYDDPNPPEGLSFTGPAGSQLENGVGSLSASAWGENATSYYTDWLTTGPNPAQYPPAGTYTVNYNGTVYSKVFQDPDAAARQVVAVPTFNIDGTGMLTQVNWRVKTPAGVDTTVPASFVQAGVDIGTDGGTNLHLEAAAGAGVATVSPSVAWSSVTWIGIQFEDSNGNSYRSDYPVTMVVAPTIQSDPVSQSISAAGEVTLWVNASGEPAPTYQWQLDGVDIPGANESSYTIPNVQEFHAGNYSVVVSNVAGSVTSASATLSVQEPPASQSRLANLSTRAQSLTGDNVLIPGFVVAGTESKRLLIRAVGASLGKAPFNIGGVLENPRLTLKRLNTGVYEDVASNDDWETSANFDDITTATASLGAFGLSDSRDAVLLVDVTPGQYTVVVDGVGGTTGIAIAELYDADPISVDSRLVNISNRGFVGSGNAVMIPGFVISDEGPKTLLLRVVGPTLAGFGVSGTMDDPKLVVYRTNPGDGTSTAILSQDNWSDGAGAANTAQVAQQVGAFPLTDGSADAAFVVTLDPGIYTVVGSSAEVGGTGVVLVEVYVVE